MDDDHAYSLMTPRVFYLFKYNDWALRWQGVVLRVLSLWLADMVEIYDWHSAMDMPNIYRASDSHEFTPCLLQKSLLQFNDSSPAIWPAYDAWTLTIMGYTHGEFFVLEHVEYQIGWPDITIQM